MTNGRLPLIVVLHFDETVNISTLQTSGLTLQASANGTSLSHTLTGGTVLTTANSVTVEVSVLNSDLDAIKALAPTIQSSNTSFASLAQDSVLDMVGLGNVPVFADAGLQVDSYTADLSTPTLVAFKLDLNTAQLELNFSEAVIPSSVRVPFITLQSEAARGPQSQYFTLTNGTVTNVDQMTEDRTITINLTHADTNAIKSRHLLATSKESTYVVLQRGLVLDPASNPSGLITMANAQKAAIFTRDVTRPELLSFEVEVNSKKLTLHFSETVNTSSFDPTNMTVKAVPPTPSSRTPSPWAAQPRRLALA